MCRGRYREWTPEPVPKALTSIKLTPAQSPKSMGSRAPARRRLSRPARAPAHCDFMQRPPGYPAAHGDRSRYRRDNGEDVTGHRRRNPILVDTLRPLRGRGPGDEGSGCAGYGGYKGHDRGDRGGTMVRHSAEPARVV